MAADRQEEKTARLIEAGKRTRFRPKKSGNPLGRPTLPESLPLREALVRSAPATLAALRAVARTAHEQARKADGRDAAALLKVSSDCLTTLAGYELGKPWEGDLDALEQARGRRKVRAAPPSRMPALAPSEKTAPTAPETPADNTHYVNSGGAPLNGGSVHPHSAGPCPAVKIPGLMSPDDEDCEVI